MFVSREITNSDFDPQGCFAYFFVNSNSIGSYCFIEFAWFYYSFEKYFKRTSWAYLLKKAAEIGFL